MPRQDIGHVDHATVSGEQGKKDEEKAAAADQALKVYEELTQPSDREKFLAEFEANGGGKAHGSLRFALTFRQRVSDSFSTEVSATENYLTRPS